MNTWPWQAIEDEQRIQKYIEEETDKVFETISNHFYGNNLKVSSIWMKKCFTTGILLRGGADILLKYSYCEYCKSYVGPNPILRKLYNISVIRGYCTKYYDTTTVDFRCTNIDFNPFWKQLISLKLSRLKAITEKQKMYFKHCSSPNYDDKKEELKEFENILKKNGVLDEY